MLAHDLLLMQPNLRASTTKARGDDAREISKYSPAKQGYGVLAYPQLTAGRQHALPAGCFLLPFVITLFHLASRPQGISV